MNSRFAAVAIFALSAALFLGACEKDERTREAAWTDPANDIVSFPNEPTWVQPDIIRAAAHGKEGFLELSVEMPFSIKDYYLQLTEEGHRRGQLMATFYIDTDNNTQSGHAPLQLPSRGGYEFSVPMSLGFWSKSKESGIVRTGRITFDTRTSIYKRVPSFELKKLHEDYEENIRPSIHVGVKSFDTLTAAQGGRMTVRVPYSMLGVKAGDAVRLCFHEAAAGHGASSYSEDKVIALD